MHSAVSTNRVHIVQASIVFAGNGIAPKAYSQIELHEAGLISEQIKDNWIFSSQIVQLQQENFSLLVLPNQLTFGLDQRKSEGPSPELVGKVLEIQGSSLVAGCGMNFTWHIHFEESRHREQMLRCLGMKQDGFASYFGEQSDGIGAVGSKAWHEGRLNLDVRASGTNNDYLNLVFNFHAEAKTMPIQKWIDRWAEAKDESEHLTNELKEAGDHE